MDYARSQSLTRPFGEGLRADVSRHAQIRYVISYSSPNLPTIPFTLTDSVTRSPLYSIYGETIAGVTVLRAFGASSKFLRDMLRCADTVGNCFHLLP